MDATTIAALIGVMLLSAALAVPGLLAFARNQRVSDSADDLRREQAQKIRVEREEATERRLDTTQAELDDMRRLLNGVQAEMNELRRGLALLLAQLEAAGLTPVWTPPRGLQPGTTKAALRRGIRETFSLDEMRDLALDMGASDSDISGDTATVYVRELVEWCARRSMLEELERRVQELRP